MDARYSYQSSQFQVGDPLLYQPAAFEPPPRRFASAVGRFFYRLIVLCLIVGAVGGVLFGLYRNDILLTIARGAGVEAQYRSLEQRIGAPGWGTPRSIVLPKNLPADAPAAAAAAQTSPEAASKEADHGAPKAETVPAAATAESKKSTADGLPIVSLDSLPSLPAKGAAEPQAAPAPVSLTSLPSAGQKPASESKSARAVPVVLREAPTTRSVPAPKAAPAPKPEPVAKAAPAPKPEPPPEPKVDPTKPKASDNPLKAAIRAAMAKQPKSQE